MGLSHGKLDSGATAESILKATDAVFHPVPGGIPNGPAQTGVGQGTISSFASAGPVILLLFFGSAVVLPAIYALRRRFFYRCTLAGCRRVARSRRGRGRSRSSAESLRSRSFSSSIELQGANPGADLADVTVEMGVGADAEAPGSEAATTPLRRSSAGSAGSGADSDAVAGAAVGTSRSSLGDGAVQMVGYRAEALGTLCSGLLGMVYPVLFIWYLVILFDTYWDCQVKGPDALCFFGSRPIFGDKFTDSEIFFAWWCVALVWNVLNFVAGHRFRNYFREECAFADAEYVFVAVRNRKERTVVETGGSGGKGTLGERAVALSRALAAWCYGEDGDAYSYYRVTVPVDMALSSGAPVRSIDVLCRRYVYDSDVGVFQPATHALPGSYSALRALGRGAGVGAHDARARLALLGENAIPYRVAGWGALIRAELSSYLYLYQFTIYTLWLWFSAVMWGAPQVLVVLGAAVVSVVITRNNQRLIQRITAHDTVCTVRRDGEWTRLPSKRLIPGDVLQLGGERNWVLPCDAVLTQGTCITDESGLTVVTETGIRTEKGSLISHILFPADMVFQYDEELRIVFFLLVLYAIVLFGVSIWLQLAIEPLKWVSIFAFALFTVSQILPPLLPIALVVGHQMSAKRLSARGILCVNPKRIAISGKVHAFMFDKTGTLTKQGLDFLGVRALAAATTGSVGGAGTTFEAGQSMRAPTMAAPQFAAGVQSAQSVAGTPLARALGTCHAVAVASLGGGPGSGSGKQLVGNQVEVKMLTASGYELLEPTKGGDGDGGGDDKAVPTWRVRAPETGEVLSIERRFEFDHHTMTMSVLVRDARGEVFAFTKGSPEKIGELATATSLPPGFAGAYQAHALDGCYVLGMACRKLGKLPEAQVAAMPRAEVEARGRMELIGLLLFRNELKPDTAAAIDALHGGDVRTAIVTGDNAQCGCYIARAARFIRLDTTVYLGDASASNEGGAASVAWRQIDANNASGNAGALTTAGILALCGAAEGDEGNAAEPSGQHKVALAMTGKALALLTASGDIKALLLHTRVFARVKPEQKVQVVQLHMGMGLITAMCGDGGNDCGALRAAHAGVALSDAEASVVSPFTSASKSVRSCVDLLQEGRCALATSFAAYRFYITYGLNWSIVKTVNFVYGVRMPITGYLTVDSLSSWLVAWAITLSQPLPVLLPYRPTTSLFAPQVVLSVLVPWAMWMLLLGGGLLLQQHTAGHVNFPAQLTKGVGYWELGDSWESTVFTTFMVFPLVWMGVVYSLGSKFRRGVCRNPAVWAVWGAIFALYVYLMLSDVNDVTAVFHVASNPFNGRNTGSPVWMRYQYPRGCHDAATGEPTAAYKRAQAAGSAPTNCGAISAQVAACGPACLAQDPPYADPSPGMPYHLRVVLLAMVLCGMGAVLAFQIFLNRTFLEK